MRGKITCCPKCDGFRTKITCQKLSEEGTLIRRYRKCLDCSHTFRTTQPVELHDDDGTLWGIRKKIGYQSHAAIFTCENIRKIRSTYKTGQISQLDLSFMFDCAQSTINRIVTRKSYKNVED